MQHFAACDWHSIHAISTDPNTALERGQDSPGAGKLLVATISDELAADIKENGWDPDVRSFEIFNGEVMEITPKQGMTL